MILYANHVTHMRPFLLMEWIAKNAQLIELLPFMVFAQAAHQVKRPEMAEHAK